MEFKECIKFATQNPVCFFATSEADQPRVRTLLLWRADEKGFYFAILSPKAVFSQLKQNAKVEVCFFNNAASPADWKTMRVTGRIHVLSAPELRKQAAQERQALEGVIGRPLEPVLEIACISSGEAFFWTLTDALKEATLERVRFG